MTTPALRTNAPALAPSDDTAALARHLLPLARTVFHRVRDDERAPVLTVLDTFLRAPSPSSFLAATRVMDETLRRLLIARAGRGPLRRSFAEGIETLRGVGALPAAVIDELAVHLPMDPRAAERLHALAALVGTYTTLSARVAADADQRRRQWKALPRRRAPK